MKLSSILALSLTSILLSSCAVGQVESQSKPIDHDDFSSLLKEYVDDQGMVDYKGLQQDSNRLNGYLSLLESNHPNQANWTNEEQLAYWINAYNAFTLQLIIRNYPLESIKDITLLTIPFVSSPWDIKFIRIEGEKYDLNNIEHGIIRDQFDEPRIHFALVCAAMSCPKLRNEAYTAERLDEQLTAQAKDFINDSDKNRIVPERGAVSRIFQWYNGDFTDDMSLAEYLNQYSLTQLNANADINYMSYDWALNEQQ